MKTKLILLAALLSLGSLVRSQAILRAGVNLANVTITNDGDIDNNKTLTSFQVGVLGNLKNCPNIIFSAWYLVYRKGV